MKSIVKFILALILSILLSFLLYYKMVNSELVTKIFGISVLRVESGSMENTLSIGDIIVIKECDDYKVNDIITYNVEKEYLVTHRIIEKENGKFITKGDNNNTKDNEKVTKDDIEGKVILNSKLLKFLYRHWIVAFLVVLLILILL